MKNIQNKKILIAGGKGFLGTALFKYFTNNQNIVWLLTRNPKNKQDIYWDGKTLGEWTDKIALADIVINLCGKSVDCRYTEKNKKSILSKRIR